MNGERRFTLFGEILPVVFTFHAKERMRECQLSPRQAYQLLCDAEIMRTPHHDYKKKRYNGNTNVHYLQFGPYQFTGKNVRDKRSNEPIFLIITMSDQRMFIK